MDSDLDFCVIITDEVARRLQLPRGCKKRMRHLPENIFLSDRYKNVWPVKIVKNEVRWYFDEGWRKLSNDNLLEPLDHVLFAYKGGNVFNFKIFGSNGCDKEGVGGRKCVVNEEDIDEKENSEDREGEHVKEEEQIFQDQVEVYDVEDDTEQEEQISKHREMQDVEEEEDINYSSESDDSDDGNYVREDTDDSDEVYVMEEYEDEEEERKNVAFIKTAKLNSKGKVGGASDSQSKTMTEFGIGSIPRKRSYRKTNTPDCYGADVFNLGLIPRPRNPYFVSRSRSVTKPYELSIPGEVIRDHSLSIPVEFVLVDEKGGKWMAKLKQWADGRLTCTRGWSSLCKANGIERDDVCICELVPGQDQKDFCIKVQHLKK